MTESERSSANQSSSEPVRKVRTYEQVTAQIEQRVLDGATRPGDRLPSEREFAQLLRGQPGRRCGKR
ncbi:GntR family transcriptional regulator [Saccharopolyspora aridisoli]|uniref:GntR family transcriptional regulator n=1 Tax=Saccharopolyspora aridisoli TaxID=2530385 RepID=A0A4R4UVX1_9PSEU|nr:GntR family transcriptional regulator [Saccharopolyspora aridisoli]